MAGRLLLDELRHNVGFLETVVSLQGKAPPDAPPRRFAWEGVGPAFLRLADRELAERVSAAYRSTESVWVTIGYLRSAHDEDLNRLRDLSRKLRGREQDAVAEDAEELQRLAAAVERFRNDLRDCAGKVDEVELPFLRNVVVPAVEGRVYSASGFGRVVR
jgi:hypothetical protein